MRLVFLTTCLVFFSSLNEVVSYVCRDVDEEELDYCYGLVTYQVIDNATIINTTVADDTARSLYEADLAIWLNATVTCEDQEYGVTMCNDCLAIRRRYHCANAFPKCTADSPAKGLCKGLCEDVNERCSAGLSCGHLPDSDCSPASNTLPSLLTILLLGLAVHVSLS